MKTIENLANLKVFMIGIGGISMSGLAKLLLNAGARVLGSDISFNDEITNLISLGATIYHKHSADNISKDIDLVVFSGAIKEDNCEFARAKNLGLNIIERSEFLGILSQKYSHVIAISGTHGKTTTTSMISEIFYNAGLNPTIHLGGVSVNLGSNTIIGNDEFLILEACEYRESFRFLNPETSIIINIERDHLDYYKDYNHIKLAFQNFANNSKHLICSKEINIESKSLIDINDYKYKDLKFINGAYEFDVYYQNEFFTHITLNILGEHNIINSIYAIAVANFYNIDKEIIAKTLFYFKGVKRRYETIGKLNNIPIIIDYAHHPTEIKNSYKGVSQVFNNILVVFQPHTYSRTLSLFNEFIDVLRKIPYLIIYTTYPARETEIVGGRAEDLCFKLTNALFADNIELLIQCIDKKSSKLDIDCVLVLGAGDLAEKLKNHDHWLK